jgi:hypothetical protein
MRSADYTRNAATLPALYQDDAASFAQVDAYLGLADDLNEALVDTLDSLSWDMGPDAAARWPAHVPLGAGRDALMEALTDRYDQLTQWFALDAPSSWGLGETGVVARRRFVSRAARLWRRRGTPRGFVDWFCTYFGIEAATERPFLLEHFKVPGGVLDAEPYTATLFVPNSAAFADYRRRLEAAQFARWYAPAHVVMRVCYVEMGRLETLLPFTSPATLPASATDDELAAYGRKIRDHATFLRELACSVVSVVDHGNGIRIFGCADDGEEPFVPPYNPAVHTERPIDHLDVGSLPTTDTTEEGPS